MERTFPKFTLPGAEESLRHCCMEAMQALYGNNPPEFVAKRLEEELAMMQGTNHSSVYMLVHQLAKYLKQCGYRTGMRGTFGSTLVSFLLEITEENPLPAHYRCPNCKHTERIPEAASGYDLPIKTCPHCARELHGDGNNLPYEICMGLVPGAQEPYVEMHMSPAAREPAVRYLVQLLGEERIARACEWNNPVCFMLLPEGMSFEDVTPVTELDPPIYGVRKQTVVPGYELMSVLPRVLLLPLGTFDCISRLHQLTNTKPENIHYNDPRIYQLFMEQKTCGIPRFASGACKNILEKLQKIRFSDLVRICGMDCGSNVWHGNGEELLKSHPFHELIGDWDDIFLALQNYGVDRETAYAVAETVRGGKLGRCSEQNDRLEAALHRKGVPQWYIDSMKRIEYLFCKSHLVALVKLYFCLAWFKAYYSKEFYDVCLKNAGTEDSLHYSTGKPEKTCGI